MTPNNNPFETNQDGAPKKPVMPDVSPEGEIESVDQAAILQQIASMYPFPDAQAVRLQMPQFIRENLKRRWKSVAEGKTVVKSYLTQKDKVEFRIHSHDSKWGEVIAFLRYSPKHDPASPMVTGFYIVSNDEDQEDVEALGTEAAWDTPEEQANLKEIWKPAVKAVETREGERRPTKRERRDIMKTPPDWPCPCKSGKVFGLCCGLPGAKTP